MPTAWWGTKNSTVMATEKPTLPAPEELVNPVVEDAQAAPAETAGLSESETNAAENAPETDAPTTETSVSAGATSDAAPAGEISEAAPEAGETPAVSA